MILAVDIGNSGWKSALFEGSRVLQRGKPDRILVSSVNPVGLRSLLPRLKALGAPVRIAGRDFEIPLRNLAPSAGTDRLLGAYAAWRLSGKAVLVLDAGTALTANVVDARGRFLGGAIFAGPGLALKALAGGTALLPRVRPAPAGFPASSTREAIRAGVRLACLGFAREAIAEAKGNPSVFLTGGAAGFLEGIPGRLRPRLVLEGLAFCAVP